MSDAKKPPSYDGPGYLGKMVASPRPPEPPPEVGTDPGRPSEHRVHRGELERANLKTRLFVTITAGAFSAVGLGALAIVYEELRGVARAAGMEGAALQVAPFDAGLKGHEARLNILEQNAGLTRVDVHEAREDVSATRLELRDLYKAVMEGKRSERLERPPPPILQIDGGHQ